MHLFGLGYRLPLAIPQFNKSESENEKIAEQINCSLKIAGR